MLRRHDSRRALFIVVVIAGAAVIVCVVARWLLGSRGLLVPGLLFTLAATTFCVWLGWRWLKGAGDPGLSVTNRRVLVGMATLPLSFAASPAGRSSRCPPIWCS